MWILPGTPWDSMREATWGKQGRGMRWVAVCAKTVRDANRQFAPTALLRHHPTHTVRSSTSGVKHPAAKPLPYLP